MNYFAVALMWLAMQQAPSLPTKEDTCMCREDGTSVCLHKGVYEYAANTCQIIKPAPEPMDVPAVTDGKWTQMLSGLDYDNPHEEWKAGKDHFAYMRWWTCADKTRILMMSEDNTRHCIKFPK